MKISECVLGNQFADIAGTSDGTVYITWRQFEGDSPDCGSGPCECQSGFVFFRHDSQVRSTAR